MRIPYGRFVEEDVQKAFNSMKIVKTARPSSITSDLLKLCENENVPRQMRVANDLVEEEKVLDS